MTGKSGIVIISICSLLLLSCSNPFQVIRDEFLKNHTTHQEPAPVTVDLVQTEADVPSVNGEKGNESEQFLSLPEKVDENSGSSEVQPDVTADENLPNHEQQRRAQEQENLDQAIELLGKSQVTWEEGNLESALHLLDQAYSLILDVDGEPDVAWQKDDLRFMIAKRILEIYTSRSNVATGCQSEIPLIMNADVKREIKRYQRGERRFFIASYKRSGKYRPVIVKLLREAGLPEELSWLPLVESGFKFKALSSKRALGLWQIIPSTGYKFGLKRDHFVDERMDLEKSTRAAVAYLKELHGIFGDWLTVLAAYNCGEGRVLRVIARQHMNYLDNFWDLYRQLPIETAQYVPRFMAVLHIINDPTAYGMDLGVEIDKPIVFETVKTNKCMKLRDIAKHLNVPNEQLISLNSELRFRVTPSKVYDMKVPTGKEAQYNLIIDTIPKSKIPGSARYMKHKIKKGEALSTIARKYRSSVAAIVRANHLTSKHRIRAGKILKIPLRGYSYTEEVKNGPRKSEKPQTAKMLSHTVKKGDSLWLLARRYNTTISKIKTANGLQGNRLQIGEILQIRTGAGKNSYAVRRGDCLATIAARYHISVDELSMLNGFNKNENIYPGQVLIISK